MGYFMARTAASLVAIPPAIKEARFYENQKLTFLAKGNFWITPSVRIWQYHLFVKPSLLILRCPGWPEM